jgi:hypothetical protein
MSANQEPCTWISASKALPPSMAPINVGFTGYGFATKCFHLPYILPNPDLNIYAFLQRAKAPPKGAKVESGKHCTIDYPDAKHYCTSDEFFADPKIDLVIVCTRHDSHAEFAEKALLAGKHGTSFITPAKTRQLSPYSRRGETLHRNHRRSRPCPSRGEENRQNPHRLPKYTHPPPIHPNTPH